MSSKTCDVCRGEGKIIVNPCPECSGKGKSRRAVKLKVKIPTGIDNGQTISLRGEGDMGIKGGPAGDLYVVLHVKAHEIFQRDGDDLLCEVPISFVQAALGAELEVPTMSGKAHIRIPPGTQSGTVFRLKGKGVRNVQGYGYGDLHVRVAVEVPSRLNSAQRAKLEEFAALCDEDVNPLSRSFIERARNFFR